MMQDEGPSVIPAGPLAGPARTDSAATHANVHTTAHTGADTRRRILAVALELFADRGYAGTSIRDITDRMGLTKAAVYYHFASKEDILEAVTEPLRADFAHLTDLADRRPVPKPEEILGALVDVLSRRISLIRTLMTDPSARTKHPGSLEIKEHMERIATAIANDRSGAALVRARCALGALQFGAFATAAAVADAAARPLGATRTEAILAGTVHILSAKVRAEILAAALRALG